VSGDGGQPQGIRPHRCGRICDKAECKSFYSKLTCYTHAHMNLRSRFLPRALSCIALHRQSHGVNLNLTADCWCALRDAYAGRHGLRALLRPEGPSPSLSCSLRNYAWRILQHDVCSVNECCTLYQKRASFQSNTRCHQPQVFVLHIDSLSTRSRAHGIPRARIFTAVFAAIIFSLSW
jgi:hypothetical protein